MVSAQLLKEKKKTENGLLPLVPALMAISLVLL
jgi:hypothetical protein